MSGLARKLYLGCGSILLVVGSTTARADDKTDCVAAYEDAQTLRSKSSLRASHEKLLLCSAQTCPKVVAEQCAGWLDEVEKALPTVNFAVTDEQGRDLSDVRVSFDGEVIKTSLDGKAIAVDPGPHTFKLESGNRKPIEESVVVREGEKNRQIAVSWRVTEKAAPQPMAPTKGGRISPATWVLGGVGVVGLGLFATFGALGLSQKSSDTRAGGCAPKCSDSEVSSIRTKFIVADVSLTAGLLSLAGAAIVGVVSFTSSSSSTPKTARGASFQAESGPSVSITVAPAPGGGNLGFSGSF